MVEDDRADAEGAASGNFQGRVGVRLRGRRLQLGTDAESAGQLSWCRIGRRRSVSVLGQNGKRSPTYRYLGSWQSGSRFGRIRVAAFLEKLPFFRSLLGNRA